MNYDVTLYSVSSEGAMIEALRFGNADIAIMDGGSAWVGWQQYDLGVLGADQKSDGRTYYEAHAWVRAGSEMADAYLDDNRYTDPFSLLSGKTSCHTGWLKSAGMLLPMGYLIGNEYAEVIGDADDISSLRDTIYNYFSENSSIPDSGTPYYGYSGALKCLSEGAGDVAFAKDSTVDSYCNNDDPAENEEWCLEVDEYVALPAFGRAPSHPVMYNPTVLDVQTRTAVLNALMSMNYETYYVNYTTRGDTFTGCYDITVHVLDEESPRNTCASEILQNVLNTDGLVRTTSQNHLGSYSDLISNIPGISAYFGDKLSPLSDTTNLAAAMANSSLFNHIRYMTLTTVPSIVILTVPDAPNCNAVLLADDARTVALAKVPVINAPAELPSTARYPCDEAALVFNNNA